MIDSEMKIVRCWSWDHGDVGCSWMRSVMNRTGSRNGLFPRHTCADSMAQNVKWGLFDVPVELYRVLVRCVGPEN